MASLKNVLSSIMLPGLDPDLLIGVQFQPTFEQGIRIVDRKNAGRELLSIFEEHDDLFRRPPEQLEECYCFTKLKPAGKNKVNRKLQDGSDRRFWKNVNRPEEVVVNNNVIGWVTKLVLRWDKNTPTEWHILEYRDRKMPDPDRWVLCRIYKREKNNGPGSPRGDMNQFQHYVMGQSSDIQPDRVSQVSSMNQVQIPGVGQHVYPPGPPSGDMVNNPQLFPSCTCSNGGFDPIDADIFNNPQLCPICLDSWWNQVHGAGFFMRRASGARGDMNQAQHYGMGQCSNTPNAATLTGEHMNQDQIHGVGQYGYPPRGDVVNNPQQFPSCTYSNGGIDTSSGFDPDDWNGYLNGDLDPSDFDMDG